MSVRNLLCEYVVELKEDSGLSYSDIISMCKDEGFLLTRSQLSFILLHGGNKVSVEVIEKVLKVLGGEYRLEMAKFTDDFA